MVVQQEIAELLEVVSAQGQVLHQLEAAHPVAVMLLEPEAAPVRKKYRLALQPEAAIARETEQDLRHPEMELLQELELHHLEEDMTRDEIHQNIEVVPRNRHIDEYEGAENYERPRRSSRQIAKARKKRKRRKILFIIEAIALILLLLFLFAWLKLGLINWDDLKNLRTNKLDDETAALLDGYTTVAFFGVDNRSAGHYEGGNSDSIMICTINNDTKEVKVASVYRDTVLDVDGKGTYKKCNYAYNHGGPEEAINMLNLNMDLDIQKYVAVDFFALAEVIDAFGGIDLDITEEEAYHMNSGGDMCYIWETATSAGVEVPPDVTPGTAVHVNGVQAVAYARIRKTSGGDFARAQRQRIVLEKVVEKAQNANIFTLNKVADAAFDDVGTNFTLNQILSLAKYVKDYQLVDTAGFPFYKNSEHRLDGTSVVCPCTLESNVRQLHAFLYNNPDVKLSDVVVSTSKDIENLMGLGEEDALDYGY